MKRDPENIKFAFDDEIVSTFKDGVKLLNKRIDTRTLNVDEMNRLVQGMMANKRVHVKTQTDKACMNNAVMYDYDGRDSESADSVSVAEAKEAEEKQNADAKFDKFMKQKGYSLDEEQEENVLRAKPREAEDLKKEANAGKSSPVEAKQEKDKTVSG